MSEPTSSRAERERAEDAGGDSAAHALAALERSIGAWMASLGRSAAVGLAAANALAAGLDSVHLRELAGAGAHDGPWDLDPVIEATLTELRRPPIPRASDRARLLTIATACVEHLGGRLPAAELTRIAHEVIGHAGPDLAQPLVDLDDDVLDEAVLPFGSPNHRRRKHGEAVTLAARRYLADLDALDRFAIE